MRFIVALHVLLLHETRDAGVDTWMASLTMRTAAVSFFFLLSGFVLTMGYADRLADARQRARFFVARIARLYPLYLLGLLLYLPVYWGRHHLLPTPGGPTMEQTAGVLALNLLAIQTWWPDASCVLNCPGWSVSATLFFAIALPAAVLAGRFWGPGRLWLSIGVLFALSMALTAGLVSATGLEGSWLNVFHKNPIVRLPEFLMGVMLGFLWRGDHLQWAWLRHPATLPTAGAAATALFLALGPAGIPYLHNGLLAPLFAIIVLSSSQPSRWTGWLIAGPMQRLGRASFAFYILHIPVANYLAGILRVTTGQSWRFTPAFIVLDIAAVAAVALAANAWLEQPARRSIMATWDRFENRRARGLPAPRRLSMDAGSRHP